MSDRIDIHQHYVPPRYRQWLEERGLTAGGLSAPAWTEDLALSAMDKYGVETGFLSISTPGVHVGDDKEARELAQHLNEYAAELTRRRVDRFGFLAVLTLPDVDGAISQAQYAFDELHADGVVLLANVGGRYLGDPLFDPLLEELDRRHSTVLVHPSALPGPPAAGIKPYVADFLLDTTRAAVNLVRTNAIRRYPNIKFVLSHGGGFVPFAAHRLAITLTFEDNRTVDQLLEDFRMFYVDTAQVTGPTSMPSVLEFFDPDKVLFGSDWPHASDPGVAYFTGWYDKLDLGDEFRRSIDSGNARRLLPRFTGVRP